jgi:squalene-associated FAD-dependent desaturase
MTRAVHIIGAGLAGLAAAVRLAETPARIIVHEATNFPGGRCRSYYDQATELTIDNGNHLLLSANHAALAYARTIGAERRLVGPPTAEFDFIDLATRERWTLRLNNGAVPWWIFDPHSRVPGTTAIDYLRLAPLLWARRNKTVGEVIPCSGVLYQRLIQPLLLAALNVDPRDGSAALAAAIVRETLARGGQACRPLIARDGLGSALIEPAVEHLRKRGIELKLMHELRALRFTEGTVAGLDFGGEQVELAPGDSVILAVPPYAATALVPALQGPTSFRAIVNAHFRVDPPKDFPPLIGVINGTVEWIFAFPQRLSVTISGADRLLDKPREVLAKTIWAEVAAVARLAPDLPPWQIVRERRATFAATPQEDAKRPRAATTWANLFLAGDWTATGLPATIESAIRSGNLAAEFVDRYSQGSS